MGMGDWDFILFYSILRLLFIILTFKTPFSRIIMARIPLLTWWNRAQAASCRLFWRFSITTYHSSRVGPFMSKRASTIKSGGTVVLPPSLISLKLHLRADLNPILRRGIELERHCVISWPNNDSINKPRREQKCYCLFISLELRRNNAHCSVIKLSNFTFSSI